MHAQGDAVGALGRGGLLATAALYAVRSQANGLSAATAL